LIKNFLPPSEGLPVYQDFCFKLNFPTKKMGTFSIWGVGGYDSYDKDAKTDSTEWTETKIRQQLRSNFLDGTLALNHTITMGNSTYFKTSLAATSHNLTGNDQVLGSDMNLYDIKKEKIQENKFTFCSFVNHKFSKRHTNRTGFVLDNLSATYDIWNADIPTNPMVQIINNTKNTQLLQAYTQSKIDITNKFLINFGIHYQLLTLNSSHSIEPRAGLKWNFTERQALSFAYGLHGQMQPLVVFLTNGATNTTPNENLGFSKAHHYVIGYDLKLNENHRIKIEPYYQTLYNIPVEENTTFSIINATSLEAFDKTLINKGKGKNYGIDITFERFLSDGFYYLATASIFESKYTDSDNIERNTRFNNNFIVNLLGGKEWQLGRNGKNNLLGINGRLLLRGGNSESAVDQVASFAKQDIVYDNSNPFSIKNAANYRLDISISYRINKEKHSSIWTAQLNNALFSPIYSSQVFDYTKRIVRREDNGMPFPNFSWRIEF
jgi:hypothetical protein